MLAAKESDDSDAIEDAMTLGFQFGFNLDCVPVLIAILGLEGHISHENIVTVFQRLKDPRAVDALYRATFMSLPYLAYDEFFGLACKCTWALADIGTPEARGRLEHLAESNNPQIANYAKKRIDGWADELSRKGLALLSPPAGVKE